MGRAPCCDKANVKKGPWSAEEDRKLKDYIQAHGTGGNWIALPQKAGLRRCGKSCRLRWLNYLRPNIKHGEFSDDEDKECVLVVLSNEAELPFQNVVDYTQISIKWPSTRIDQLLEYLESIPDEEIEEMISRGRKVRCLWVYGLADSESCWALAGSCGSCRGK